MKISLNWIKEFVDGLNILDKKSLEKVVVGFVESVRKHPGADSLNIAQVNIGEKTVQIVCGGVNLIANVFVPVALPGAILPGNFEIKPAKIRGEESNGMICAKDEINMGQGGKHEIWILDQSQKWQAGTPLVEALKLSNAHSPEELQNLLTHHTAEVETVTAEANDITLLVDNKSLTHRPDLWGHYGIAREIAAIMDLPLKPLTTSVNFPQTGEPFDIQVKDKKLCPRYIGTVIKNIKVEPSPSWLQNRLTAIGYKPINNVVDVTNYIMAEIGQPMHAFDLQKIEGGIVVRTAKNGETIQTLDGKARQLSKNTLVIADHQKALAIAGIMGGANSEINENTTAILLESANFNASQLRQSSVELGLRTEAVQRQEKRLDPELANQATDRAIALILQLCPQAQIATPKIDINNTKLKKITINLNLQGAFSKIGKTIPQPEVEKILTKLEFKIIKSSKGKLKVEVPSFRATKDINIPEDLIEEIARMHGYENIDPVLPELPIKLPLENKERKQKHLARQIMAELGFNEVYNYSFYSLTDIKKAQLPEELHLKLTNYLSEDQTHLRISLVPNILKNIALNLKSFHEFKLFEIGRTYENNQHYFPNEEKKIVGAIVLNKKSKDEPFYEAKGALESFFKLFGTNLNRFDFKKSTTWCPYAHPNKYASLCLKQDDTEIARIFELHPLTAKNFDLENQKIAFFEINFTKLTQLDPGTAKFKAIPKFPGIQFDVSVLVDRNIEIGTIQKAITKCDRSLIQAVTLFDLYEGANIPSGKKSLAFNIQLQSPDRTLTDEEMKTVQQKIFTQLQQMGGEVRVK